MSKVIVAGTAALILAVLFSFPTAAGTNGMSDDEKDDRLAAIKLMDEGNYLEAYVKFTSLLRQKRKDEELLAQDWNNAVACLARLKRVHELDELLEETVARHATSLHLLSAAANTLLSCEHHGVLVAGSFQRGGRRGGGAWVQSTDRDRVRALQLLIQANELVPNADDINLRTSFFLTLEKAVVLGTEYGNEWKLQVLTDLSKLPDFVEAEGGRGGRGRIRGSWQQQHRGAPVDEKGDPVFYSVPQSWQAATSDGERWRWALQQAGDHNSNQKLAAQWKYIHFLHRQFGVQSLGDFGINLGAANSELNGLENDPSANPMALRTLTDEETIAKLATGVRRIRLPDEHNPILLAKTLADDPDPGYASQALEYLAGVFSDRQQYLRAAQSWQIVIQRFGASEQRNNSLKQIVDPWGMLENTNVSAAGEPATMQLRFRNGQNVEFVARKIDQQKLLADIMAYLHSNPGELEWQKTQLDIFNQSLVEGDGQKYVGEEVARWKLDLEPRPEHFDRRITVTTPLQNAGAWLVTAKIAGGNSTNIVVWIDSLALVKKPSESGAIYYLAEALEGRPVGGADVEFFGWQNRWNQDRNRNELVTKRFAERTDTNGFIKTDPALFQQGFQWLAIARTGNGGFCWLGYSSAWRPAWSFSAPERARAYIISDRPIYRPGQTVKYKIWIREASFKPARELATFAYQNFDLVISDPQGNEVRREFVQTDANGNIEGELALDATATLGAWNIHVGNNDLPNWRNGIQGKLSFRVEEYKKPEFEVTVDTPDSPIQLGETVTARIRADYYFGGPVSNAVVKYKVHRTNRDVRWFPSRQWDWLYGNGYWWFANDSEWYPGFSRWGCLAPVPPWWGGHSEPPELVLDEETRIGEDGTAEIRIDTQLAKVLHGDLDHEYSITAEVVDASRRTIVGTGSITVSRQPWRVYTWTDRGYARVGEALTAHFSARTPDGKGVEGKAEVKLFKITWNKENKPVETVVQTWPDIEIDNTGEISQLIQASESGQYRVVCKVDDGKGNVFEGGQLLTIAGEGFDGRDFRFNDLEITLDRSEYRPGETARLMINTNRPNSTVLLWVRPVNGVCNGLPVVLQPLGKSIVYELPIEQADMPNIFVEAVTISSGKLHDVVRNIVVPPTDKTVNVAILPSKTEYLPGAEAMVKVRLTDESGEPVRGDVVLTMYDRAVEYISGGSNVSDAREFFWKWTRSHSPSNEHSLSRSFWQFARANETAMQFLGAFGHMTADQDKNLGNRSLESEAQKNRPALHGGGRGGGGDGEGLGRMMQTDSMVLEAAPMERSNSDSGNGQAAAMATNTVRANFADSAVWRSAIQTGVDGIGEVTLTMPENLTAWKIRSWAMGPATSVGEQTTVVTTKKNIMVRLQSPRFFVERDEIVLSAIVHNYLDAAKTAKVSLGLSGGTLEAVNEESQSVEVPSGGDVRVDWRVKAVAEGTADITMSAETDVESDAMKMTFPVFVHGMLKTDSYSRVVRTGEASSTIDFTVPANRRPEQSRLEIRYSPTMAGAMVDALPYLVEYPYGCTEQTLNRFVPTVITLKTLRSMNLDLKSIRDKQNNLNAGQIGDPAERAAQWKVWDRNPVFDPDEVERMVKTGIRDLTAMQCSDGGWGWFSGVGERSYPHTTAVVVHGLQSAVAADMAIPADVIERGAQWLKAYQQEQIALLDEWERIRELAKDQWPVNSRYKTHADNLDALVQMVLVDADAGNPKMTDYLYRDRTELTVYGLGVLGVTLDRLSDIPRRDMCLRNMDQFVVYDEENQSAYIDLPNNGGYLWYWYGDVIEANAYYLKLMSRVNPNDPRTAGVVKYLLNNRRFGTRWNSTRDTALCIEAMAEYLSKTGEDKPEMTIDVALDGKVIKTVNVNSENLFSFDNVCVVEGTSVESGPHKLEIRRRGEGPVYANAWMTNFSLEDHITAAGLEVKVNRKYFRLDPRQDATDLVQGAQGQAIDQKVEKNDRVELTNLAELKSGDLVEIELEIDSKNDYEYVIFEDMKPAGFEPIELRSGYSSGGLGAYVQFRDENVAFFMRSLARGKHSVSYRMRAETPGKFSALPAKAWAMYAPELKGNSEEIRLKITDAPAENK